MLAITSRSSSQCMQDWRLQIGRSSRRAADPVARPFAIVSYLIRRKPGCWPLADLRDVTLVALFDEQLPSRRLATRLVGIKGRVTASGIEFGGAELCRFDKDLRLRPSIGGRGACFDPAQGHLLALALELDRYLDRCAHYPHYPRRGTPCFPQLSCETPGQLSPLVNFSLVRRRQVIVCTNPIQLRGQVAELSYDFHTTRFRRDQ